ncbi:MAG: sigma-70 family RNA polymerase sigma factor [Oscillospiraceae bacterium]
MNGETICCSSIDEETLNLWQNYIKTKDIKIRNELVLIYMPILKKIAFKVYQKFRGIDSVEELVSEGMIALITAIDRFDLDRGVKFETYVSYRVHGAMLDYINKQSGMVRRVRDISREISSAREELTTALGREPEKTELAEYLGVSPENLDKKLQESRPISVISLDQIITDDNMDDRIIEISSGEQDDPVHIIEQGGFSAGLAKCISKLSREHQLVLSLFYTEDFSVTEIADILNTEPKRISQLRFQAIKRLKKLMEDEKDF